MGLRLANTWVTQNLLRLTFPEDRPRKVVSVNQRDTLLVKIGLSIALVSVC